MRLARMRYTFEMDIPIPDDPDYDAEFDIDENHCLGTGRPGLAFDRMRDWFADRNGCWACPMVKQEWLGVRDEPNPSEWLLEGVKP